MIVSMTGYGAAQCAEDGVSYSLEIRAVNNRYLKLSVKLPEFLQFAEASVEKLLRARVSRGSVDYTLRARSSEQAAVRTVQTAVLQKYVDELTHVRVPANVQPTIDLAAVALLPGVCEEPVVDESLRVEQLRSLETLTAKALDALTAMRREEGQALRKDLLESCHSIRERLGSVAMRAPNVITEYHQRLQSRVAALMKTGGFELEAEGLMREVAIYAERCDIGEELARLSSHLDQFAELCNRDDQVGRTLDFLTQELLREANTIASKSNDALIARNVVEIKGLIDRLREQVQNVE